MSNSLDPDQAQEHFRPGLGPNCLQSLDDKKHEKFPRGLGINVMIVAILILYVALI